MADLEEAAQQSNIELDYSIEKLLEAAAEKVSEMHDIVERVKCYWLEVDYIPGGTHFEINVRAAELLAAANLERDITIAELNLMANSENWRERLVCAWTLRKMTGPEAMTLRSHLAKDNFVDDNGLYLVREGLG